MTEIELKKLLRKYHLAATGKKEELIRLVKDVAQFLKGFPPKVDVMYQATSSQMDNMKLYESTFESFVKEEAAIDYTNVTVIELKKLLRKYHLDATGKKEKLVCLVKEVAQFLKGLPPKADYMLHSMKVDVKPKCSKSEKRQRALLPASFPSLLEKGLCMVSYMTGAILALAVFFTLASKFAPELLSAITD